MIRTRTFKKILLVGLSLLVVLGALLYPGASVLSQGACPPGTVATWICDAGGCGWSCSPGGGGGADDNGDGDGGEGDAADGGGNIIGAVDAGPPPEPPWYETDPNYERRMNPSAAEDFAVYCSPPGYIEVWRTQPDPPSLVSSFPIGWVAQTGTFALGGFSQDASALTLNNDGGDVMLSDPSGREKTFDLDACLGAAGLAQPPSVPCDQEALATTEDQADLLRRQINELRGAAQGQRNTYNTIVGGNPLRFAEEARAEAERWLALAAQHSAEARELDGKINAAYHRVDVELPNRVAELAPQLDAAQEEWEDWNNKRDEAYAQLPALQSKREELVADYWYVYRRANWSMGQWAFDFYGKTLSELLRDTLGPSLEDLDIRYESFIKAHRVGLREVQGELDAVDKQIMDTTSEAGGAGVQARAAQQRATAIQLEISSATSEHDRLRTSVIPGLFRAMESANNAAQAARDEAARWQAIANQRQERAEANIDAAAGLLVSADENDARAGQLRQELDVLEATITTLTDACEGAG